MQGMQQLWNLLILRLKLGFRFYEAEPSVCLHRPLPAIETVSGPNARRRTNRLRDFYYTRTTGKMQAKILLFFVAPPPPLQKKRNNFFTLSFCTKKIAM